MTATAHRDYLKAARDEMVAAVDHLTFSANSVRHLGTLDGENPCSSEDLEKVEAFTSRFARVVDLLIHRVLRAVDRFELNEPGTMLDVANRAEARGLVSSVDWLRELKDVRNRIAHDYAGVQLSEIFAFCQENLAELEATITRVQAYIDSLL